jgi:hypothetical protein
VGLGGEGGGRDAQCVHYAGVVEFLRVDAVGESGISQTHQSTADAVARPVSVVHDADGLVDSYVGRLSLTYATDAEAFGAHDAFEKLAPGIVHFEVMIDGLEGRRGGTVVEWSKATLCCWKCGIGIRVQTLETSGRNPCV